MSDWGWSALFALSVAAAAGGLGWGVLKVLEWMNQEDDEK